MNHIILPDNSTITYQIYKEIVETQNDTQIFRFDIPENTQLFLAIHLTTQNACHLQLKLILNLHKKNAFVHCNIFAQTKGKSSITCITEQHHFAPNTTSELILKGGAFEQSLLEHTGIITIKPSAPHSTARQTAKIMLMGDKARALTKPDLEILQNNVICSHGSAVGTLDPDQLFLCQARGISSDLAKDILFNAFFKPHSYEQTF